MDLLAEYRFARARRPRDADEDRSALGVRLQELDRADGEEETLIEREVILEPCDLLIERREGEDRGQNESKTRAFGRSEGREPPRVSPAGGALA